MLSAEVAAQIAQILGQKLQKHASKAVGLPADASHNDDDYLFETPKR